MHRSDIATLFALGAALLIAIGDVIQQRSAHDVTDEQVGPIALFLQLLRDKTWWLGSLVAAGGFALQAAALGFGSVLLVQALIVTSLLFALPLSARFAGRRITRYQWIWAVLLAAAVAVIVTVGDPSKGQARAGFEMWSWVAATLGPVLLLCLLGARLFRGKPVAAVLLGLVAGSLWGLFAVLMKGVVDELDHGIVAVLKLPELYVWAVVAIAATAIQQSSFRAGSMAASLPAVTVSEPLVASVLGVAILGEMLRPGRSGWALLVIAVVVMIAATVELARTEAAPMPDPAEPVVG
ncbi:membrane protein [Mycolicibacterium aromaticivorans JS19b1 = JCM 16368]|uniref:Membrane protein n=1 Tax=Mycolicibacterium aromaticivorans JS19b1 = JCM 16368 TaxID=1440774 RepID=A0A064CC04_9MYCO|nr:DMT family transporter [Mycolicibacterium aromaticivorans]KDE97855.1 membrane protein [Mycolicibacterium aromaticivorans JS19b1 = JCM 16368]